MKKAVNILVFLTVVAIVLPLIGALLPLLGYEFVLVNYSVWAVITALLPALAAVLGAFNNDNIKSKALGTACAVLPFLSVFNAAYYIANINGNIALVFATCFISIIACVYLALRCGTTTFNTAMVLVSACAAVGFTFIGFAAYILSWFSVISVNTVTDEIESPSGRYVAQIIDNDQGALGGATFVDIVDKDGCIDAFVFKITEKPERIYSGDWGKTPHVHWKSENCIVVNSIEYEID